jgi:hypothetical protein
VCGRWKSEHAGVLQLQLPQGQLRRPVKLTLTRALDLLDNCREFGIRETRRIDLPDGAIDGLQGFSEATV